MSRPREAPSVRSIDDAERAGHVGDGIVNGSLARTCNRIAAHRARRVRRAGGGQGEGLVVLHAAHRAAHERGVRHAVLAGRIAGLDCQRDYPDPRATARPTGGRTRPHIPGGLGTSTTWWPLGKP